MEEILIAYIDAKAAYVSAVAAFNEACSVKEEAAMRVSEANTALYDARQKELAEMLARAAAR